MSYEPGKMGIAEGTVLVFFTTFTSVFLSVWSAFFDEAATAAWLSPVISVVIFIMMFMAMLFVMERVPGDLCEIAETLLGKTGARLMTLYLIAVFYGDAVILLRQFGENTLLTALPDVDMSLIIGWYALMAALLIYLGIETIARTAYVVLPFGIAGSVPVLLLLYDKFNVYHLSPWLGDGLSGVLHTGVLASGFFLAAFILPILASSFQNLSTIRTAAVLGLGMCSFFRTLTLFIYTGIFGVAVGREKVLPFFEMARLVYVNRFIQRVEAFFIILWVIYGIATIAINLFVASYLLTRLFHLPSLRPFILPLTLITVQLALLPPEIATAIELHMQASTKFNTLGVFAIPVILLVAALIKGKRKAPSCAID